MQKNILGTVVHGLGKGKELGFPTVNIRLNDSNLHIENGVYATSLTIFWSNNSRVSSAHFGMLYVGTRPTFQLQTPTIEIHIFNFNENLYNQQISFNILHKIRNEISFSSVEKLVEQLHQDKKMVYDYLSSIFFNSSKL
ncbi:MAG: riboflavin kinase [Firmicutes bacterium]|nr:riboflavin kinase [Bacillota bacterium]